MGRWERTDRRQIICPLAKKLNSGVLRTWPSFAYTLPLLTNQLHPPCLNVCLRLPTDQNRTNGRTWWSGAKIFVLSIRSSCWWWWRNWWWWSYGMLMFKLNILATAASDCADTLHRGPCVASISGCKSPSQTDRDREATQLLEGSINWN